MAAGVLDSGGASDTTPPAAISSGRGVGSALLQGLIDCADASLGLRRIDLTVFSDNASAIALYRKFGFVEEGRSRGFALRDGVLADVLHMARLVDAPRLQTI